MADVKKAAATAKPVAKAVAATKVAETKEVKEVKAEVKKETAKKAPAKKAEPAKKETVKKETAKKAPAKKAATTAKKAPAKKAEVKANISVQFDGKEYKAEDLIKIAKDVWKYDLGKKAADFKSLELYVKPEESRAYYVINGETTGSFAI